MLKRMVVGLLLGALVGGAVAAALVEGLGFGSFAAAGAWLAYASVAAAGALTGLVAGKPIWASGGAVEALLKAVFGAALAAAGLAALRHWGADVHVDVPMLHVASGALADLPVVVLPAIGGALGAFFELDNTGDKAATDSGRQIPTDTRASNSKNRSMKARVEELPDESEDDVVGTKNVRKR